MREQNFTHCCKSCPWHGAKWDAKIWKFDFVPTEIKGLESYKVIVENDTVYVDV